jgi:DNA polymerase III subunit gamma/tau
LKLAHAQRLLPIEQLLSGTELRSPAPERKPAIISEQKKSEPLSARPFISPFAADSARKGTPRSDASGENTIQRPAPTAITSAPVVMGSAAPAVAREPETSPGATLVPQQKAAPESERNSAGIDEIRVAVLEALASGGQNMLCSMLEPGEWKIAGNELVIRIAASATLIEMSVGAEAKRRITAAASDKLGRAVKLQVLPGAAPVSTSPKPFVPSSNGSTRSRAEQEPVVQRLKEKFGAQIRTVIDYTKR